MCRVMLKNVIKSILLLPKYLLSYPKIIFDAADYDEYWKDKKGMDMGNANDYQRIRARWIAEKIDEGSTVLDLGCGDGAVLLEIRKTKNIKPIGVDISNYALDFCASQNIETIKIDLIRIEEFNALPEVDFILMLEFLEHIPNPEKALKILESKARKAMFFSFPNSGYIVYRLRYLSGRFPVQWLIHPGEHIRFWTYKDLKWWLKELGYAHCSTIYVYKGIFLLNKIWKNMFSRALMVEVRLPGANGRHLAKNLQRK